LRGAEIVMGKGKGGETRDKLRQKHKPWKFGSIGSVEERKIKKLVLNAC